MLNIYDELANIYNELVKQQIEAGIVERFTAPDGRPGLRYLKDDEIAGVAAGSEVLDATTLDCISTEADDVLERDRYYRD